MKKSENSLGLVSLRGSLRCLEILWGMLGAWKKF